MWGYTVYIVVRTTGLANKTFFICSCPQKTHTLLVRTLQTKSDIRATTYTVKQPGNIHADKNFCTKMRGSKKHAKPSKKRAS